MFVQREIDAMIIIGRTVTGKETESFFFDFITTEFIFFFKGLYAVLLEALIIKPLSNTTTAFQDHQ
jgi:hypothetical protein